MDVRRLVYLVIVICHVALVRAQDPLNDSLAKKLDRARSWSEKAEVYYKVGDDLALNDTVKAVAYIRKGLVYAKDNPLYQGIGYFYLGRVYMEFSHPKAEEAFDTALRYFQSIETSESYIYQSRTWANKAVMAQMKGDNKTYINLFLEKAIPLAARGRDSLRMADGYTNVSLPFMNYGEYDKAIFYLHKSAALFQRLAPDDLRRVDVHCHLAKIYLLQNKIAEAGTQISIASGVLQQDPQSLYAPNFHTIESMYLIKRRQWEAAEKTIEKGLSVAEKLKNRYDIRQLLYQKSGLYSAQGNWAAAKAVLLKMYNEGYVELITDKRQLYADLAKMEHQLGNNSQAYDWMVKQAEVSEEVYAQQTKSQITELEAKYNFAQKEKELLISKEKSKKQKQIIWLTVLAALLALTGLYFWYRNRRAKAVQLLKQQQQIALGKALLEGEERERSRMAKDLHDGLGGMLAGIKLNLSQMIRDRENIDKQNLEQTVDRLGHSVSELRRISRNMMPESLVQSGLETALRDLCDEASMPGLKISFRAFNIHERFSPQIQVMVYRIVQELVYNAVKHSGASKVLVQCSRSENIFFITVEDNGKGFSAGHIPRTSRGLKNIHERVELLNGKIEIETSWEGTNINIELYAGQ